MSFDKQYPNRKDRRRPYRGVKAIDGTCRNHGSCPMCESGRKHTRLRQQPADDNGVVPVFTVGQHVIYADDEWTVEKDYGNDVYFLGNEDAFCDLVPGHLITPKPINGNTGA